jgi:formate hydrogenlyase transcriptional activator
MNDSAGGEGSAHTTTGAGDGSMWHGTVADVGDGKQTHTLIAGENRLFEMIARDEPLATVLDSLCRLVEDVSSGSLAAILLLDPESNTLSHAAAPSLPRAYTSALDHITPGPNVGACGTAAYRNEAVISADIATDPLWDDFRDIPLSNGLRACWSTPIRSCSGAVLGTFAILFRHPHTPTPQHFDLIEQITHVASLAIDRSRTLATLRQHEQEFRQIVDFVPQHIIVLAPDGSRLYANRMSLEYSGHTLEEFCGAAYDYVVHPDDLARLRSETTRVTAGEPFELEARFLGADGIHRWFLLRHNPLRDEDGGIIRWYVTGTEIEDRKQAEKRIQNENIVLREEIDKTSMFEEVVGASAGLQTVLTRVSKVAPTDSTVLITGETGTGKELIARGIHKRSARSECAFVSVNCAAIPQSLIASELFGHEKGAFTGALQRRLGRFELASGGTLFLDEVGELPAETQVALLRVLQEREFERVGGSQAITADVRVIAATNRDLQAAIAVNAFRSDLFYRLSVFPIEIPPLRERRDDIRMLVEYFIDRYARSTGKRIRKVARESMELLQSYRWPGNIRELQNVIERSVILCDGDTFSVDESWLPRGDAPTTSPNVHDDATGPRGRAHAAPLSELLTVQQSTMIEAALAESHGKVAGRSGAATRLGMRPSTLESRIRSLGIDKHRFKST